MESKGKYLKERMNTLGRDGIPFLFILAFDAEDGFILTEEETLRDGILFNCRGITNRIGIPSLAKGRPACGKHPEPIEEYRIKFHKVMHHLERGDSYLLNLTCETPVTCDLSLNDIFFRANAAYKLLLPGRFTVFSPECFVRIQDRRIAAYPMKGTIDASIEDAEQRILDNPKEKAEHNTIVDLLRNDLSMVASDVRVERFRYIEKIETNQKSLLQVSSAISGILPADYKQRLGDILFSLLPAGSVSGAPKKRTVEIINAVEGRSRGFYTGVFGYYDGQNLDSAVMIRFIEERGGQLYYQSGGGITAESVCEEEYREMIDKIYVPLI